jgi:predicted transcriptional regulator
MTAIQRAILQALRFGGLNQFEIAEVVDQAPFRVRAELQALKRERLVTPRHGHGELAWVLTERGLDLAWEHHWNEHQTELFR